MNYVSSLTFESISGGERRSTDELVLLGIEILNQTASTTGFGSELAG
jgi:hypothetical protein